MRSHRRLVGDMRKIGLMLSGTESCSPFGLRFIGEFNGARTVVIVADAPNLLIQSPFHPSNDVKLNRKLSILQRRWSRHCFDVSQPSAKKN